MAYKPNTELDKLLRKHLKQRMRWKLIKIEIRLRRDSIIDYAEQIAGIAKEGRPVGTHLEVLEAKITALRFWQQEKKNYRG